MSTDLLLQATKETFLMVVFSSFFAILIGLPFGIILTITRKGGIAENFPLYRILDGIINILRSMPFIILMIVVFPLSRIIVGKTIGTVAAIVPLSISAAPFVARIMENAFNEVDSGIVEASLSMGSSNLQIIFKVIIPEALPSIINNITMTIINITGYSAMAGAIGGGGLGDVAIRYGWQRNVLSVLWPAILIIVVFVQIVQFSGNKLSYIINKK